MSGLAALSIGARLTGAKAVLAKIPPRVWYALAAVALLIGGVLYHHHQVRKHDAAIILAEDTRINAMALKMKAKVAALTAQIAQTERTKNDAENHRIAADAGALRLSGPGKAVCPGRIVAPASASGHIAPGRPADAAVDPLPDPAGLELIGLPFNDAVSFGADHDLDRAEVLSWRDWYRKLVAAWPKEAPQPR